MNEGTYGVYRRPSGPKTDGEDLRDDMVKVLAQKRARLLNIIRLRLRNLARVRDDRIVDTDDAHRIMDGLVALDPYLAGIDRRFFGALWRGGPWEYIGEIKPSSRKACHARPIKRWRLT